MNSWRAPGDLFQSGLSLEARGAYLTVRSWACTKLSDGRVSARAAALLEIPPRVAAELVTAGFWRHAEDGNGWIDVDYLKLNDSAEAVRTTREAAKERVAKARANKGSSVSDSSTERTPQEPPTGAIVFQLSPTRWSQQIGREWFAELFARLCGKDTSTLDYSKPDKAWNPQLGRLGAKSEKDRATVAKHALETSYLLERPSQLNPEHLLKFWDDFLAGPRTVMKQPVSTRGFNPAMKPSSLDDDSGRAPEWVGKP